VRFPLKPVTRLLVTSPVIFGLSIAALAACSSGGGTSSAAPPASSSAASSSAAGSANCIIQIGTSIGNAYLVLANPGGSVSAATCQAAESGATSSGGSTVTSAIIGSLPSGLTQACTGLDPGGSGFTYTVYDDGSMTGSDLGTGTCKGITSGGS